MYVSYDFYKQTFGDTIPEADFSKVEAKAEAVREAEIFEGCFAISTCPSEGIESPTATRLQV